MMLKKKRRSFRRTTYKGPAIVAVILGLATLAACTPRTGYWSTAESPKRNRVSWAEFHHAVRFNGTTAEIDKAERDALLNFMHRVGRGQGVRITLASATNGATRLGLKRETALADFLRGAGYTVALGPVNAQAGGKPNSVRVTVGRHVTRPPACPDWSKPATGDPRNQVTSNFGCATATNLGLMVADPGVLVRGTELGPADGEAVAVGIKDYRAGKEQKPAEISPLSITGKPTGGK